MDTQEAFTKLTKPQAASVSGVIKNHYDEYKAPKNLTGAGVFRAACLQLRLTLAAQRIAVVAGVHDDQLVRSIRAAGADHGFRRRTAAAGKILDRVAQQGVVTGIADRGDPRSHRR